MIDFCFAQLVGHIGEPFEEYSSHLEDDVGIDILFESIKGYGCLSPLIIRPDEGG